MRDTSGKFLKVGQVGVFESYSHGLNACTIIGFTKKLVRVSYTNFFKTNNIHLVRPNNLLLISKI